MIATETFEDLAAVPGAHVLASIDVTDAERAKGALDPEKLERAVSLFREQGYIRVENLFSAEQMRAFDTQYRARYRNLLSMTNKTDKRPLFTVDIDGAFNDRVALANPVIAPLIAALLGEDFIIAAVSAVASFPGAPDQHLHRDAAQLFGKNNEGDAGLPPYSVSILVPLIDFTQETGCTRIWPGSHHIAGREAGLAVGSLDPEVRVGSALISDGRVLHRGAANHSDRLRPLFYVTYHRSWYRDFGGYDYRPPILLGEAEYSKMPADLRARVAWFRDRYRSVNRKNWLRRAMPPALRVKLSKDT